MALTRPKFYQVDTTITAFNDPITVLNSGATQANVDVGFLFNRANGLVSNVALYWSEDNQTFTTAYTTGAGANNSNISATSYANIKTGNITAAAFFWANGAVFSSSYGNTDVAAYLPSNATITGIQANLGAYQGWANTRITAIDANLGTATTNINTLFSNAAGQANQITGANAAIVTANSAVVSFVGTINNNLSAAITGNINSVNSTIITANTNMKSYVDTQDSAITTAWSANAATQQTQINNLASGANANVAAYLPGYTGSLGSITTLTTSGTATVGGNLNVSGNLNVTGNVSYFSSNDLVVTDSLIYLADGNTGDVLDIGIVSAFTNPGYQHTGLVRDASDGVWKLFANVVAEPTTTVNFTNATYSPLRIGALTATSGTYSGAIIASTVSAGTIGNSGATLTGTLSTASQTNITSLGTLTSLAVTGTSTISVNSSSDALRITQTGAGNAFVVEDSVNPDATAFVITANGQVGVGNVSPQATLHVKGNSGVGGLHTDFIVEAEGSGNARFFLKTETNNRNWEFFAAGSDGGFGVYDGVGVARRFTILPSGNVGIGVNSPTANLQVSGTTALATTTTSILNATAGNVTTLAATNFSSGNIYFTGTTTGTVSTATNAINIGITANTTAGNAYVTFAAATSGNVAQNVNSGIVFNPSTGNLLISGNVGIGTAAPAGRLALGMLVSNRVLSTYDDGTNWYGLGIAGSEFRNLTPANWTVGTYARNTDTYTERVRVDSTGNVGIGATPDTNLHVSSGSAKLRIGLTSSSQYFDIYRDSPTGFTIYNAAQADPYRAHIWQLSGTEAMRIATSGNVAISTTTASTSSTTGALVVKGGVGISGNVIASGYGQFSGVYNESSTTSGIFLGNTGTPGGITPRVGFFNGNSSQNWQIDNNNGTFRWFTPGVSRMELNGNTSQLTVSGNVSSADRLITASGVFWANGAAFSPTVSSTNYASAANVSLYESVAATTTNATHYPMLSGTASGNTASFTASGLTYNPSTGNLGVGTSTSTAILHAQYPGNGGVTGANVGVWAAKVVNSQDAAAYNGLSVQNRWAAATSTTFETAMGWDGASVGYYPTLTVDGLGQTTFKPYRTEAMKIFLGGNIAISTTTASTNATTGALVVKGGTGISGQLSVAGGISLSEAGGAGTRLIFSTSGSGAVINQNDNSPISLQIQGTTGLILSAAGNVGIGTSAPLSKLDVNGVITNAYTYSSKTFTSGSWYRFLTLDSSNAGQAVTAILRNPGGHDSVEIKLSKHTVGKGNLGYVAEVRRLGSYAYAYNIVKVRVCDDGTNQATHLEVQFGTGNPTATMQLLMTGAMRGTGFTIPDMTAGASGLSTTKELLISDGVDGTSNQTVLGFSTAAADLFYIKGTGTVGVGTSSPEGKIHSENAAASAGWAYVAKSVGVSNQSGTWVDASNNMEFAARNGSGTLTAVIRSSGASYLTGGNVGIGTSSPSYTLQVNGSFAATTKSFVIDHPTKPDMKLRYGSLEGPENGVYVRGRLTNNNIIELPDYWTGLVDPDSITVQLTPIGRHQNLYVEDIADNKVVVGNGNLLSKAINCFYVVFAERKDVDKLEVEVK